MAYKLAIFDFDGTLADSVGWMKRILPELAARAGFRVPSDEQVEALRQRDSRAILSELAIPLWRLPVVAVHLRRIAARDAGQIRLHPGASELLAQLERRGIRIGIVSSNSEPNIRRILGPQTAAKVGFYACNAGLFGKRWKFRRVLQRAQLLPAAAIAIGDEVRDIEAAAAEGIDTGAVTWGYATEDALRARRPTAVFTSFEELLRAVAP